MSFTLVELKNRKEGGLKKLVVLALEKVTDGLGRAYDRQIESSPSKEFLPFFESYISKDAKTITDKWHGYIPLKKEYLRLEQIESKDGKNFPDIHIHIMNLKEWLREIHHHSSKKQLQGYLDEYHFRYNRRNNMGTIFDLLLVRFVNSAPIRLN
jgi:hypothetical protein